MRYISIMSFMGGFSSGEAADIYLEKLMEGLEELGIDDAEIIQFDTDDYLDPCGAALKIAGQRIALGIGENEFEAAQNLLERAGDLFFDEIPEV